MSLQHALLTALLEQPASGLELAGRFDRSIGHYWHATHQQIYRELARLEEAGWVVSTPDETGRGKKRLYRVLPGGQAELKRWASTPIEHKPLRDDLIIRLHAEVMLGEEELQHHVAHQREKHQHESTRLEEGETLLAQNISQRLALHQEKLKTLRVLEQTLFNKDKPSRQDKIRHLILSASVMQESMSIQICQLALEVLAMPQ